MTRFERLTGLSMDHVVNTAATTRLIDQGFLEQKNGHLIATPGGRLALNEILRQLLAS